MVVRERSYGTDSTTGRGLRLVATLAAAWGVDRTLAGKTVWFEVPAAGDTRTTVEPWDADRDLDALLAGFDDPGEEDRPRPLTALGGRPPSARALRVAA